MTLQIDTDMDFQRRAWRAQRIGWVVLFVIVLLGLAGVFGNGPLSQASSEGARLAVEYQRFARLGQSTELRIKIQAAPDLRVDLSRAYLEYFRIDQVTPEPRSVEGSQDWISYNFEGAAPLTINFDLLPNKIGSAGGVARGFGETLLFRQFIYP